MLTRRRPGLERALATLVVLFVLCCGARRASALAGAASPEQQGQPNVTGRVLDASSMRPIPGATLQAADAGGLPGATTAPDGTFQLTLPKGKVRLKVAAEAYLPDEVEVVVGDAPVKLEIVLLNKAQFKEDVVVTAGVAPVAQSPASVEVSPLEVRSVAGAIENVFRVLQTLPGVSATADFDSRLAVRGGGPDQNLTIMDGVEIHNPYRLFGLTSAFNPETVENFELTAGGFSARYGDRLSSILLIENRPGTRARAFAGSAALSLTDGNVVLEGRLPGGVAGSWLVTGRRTYYDLAADRITGTNLPSFGDVQAKAVWEPAPGRRVTLFALRSRETTDASFENASNGNSFGLTDLARNDLVSLSFFSTIGGRASSRTIASWYRYGDALGAAGDIRNDAARSNAPGDDEAFARAQLAFTRDLVVRDASLRQEFAFKATGAHLLEAGFEAHALDTTWGWRIAGDRNFGEANGSSLRGGSALPSLLDSRRQTLRPGAWVLDRYQASPRVAFEPGVRFDWNGFARELTASPRLSADVALAGRWRLRAATGLFVQSPGYEKLLQADYFVDLTAPDAAPLRSERSVHVLGGLERDFGGGLVGRAEVYYKTFDRMIVGRLETPAETAARVALYDFPPELAASVPAAPQITTSPVNGASGRAYGFDVFVSRRPTSALARLGGWVSYTWGHADIDSYGRRYPFDYDRRHAFSAVGTYRVSKGLELGATLRVASGFPYSPVVGLRVASVGVPDASGVVHDVPERDASGQLVWTTDPGGVATLNSARLPLFARLDTRVTFKPGWSGNRWQLYVEIINALNRKNAGTLDSRLEYDPTSDRPRLVQKPVAALPFLPSLGLRVSF
jgi:hypothetical protein